jgi:uncharacterized membrane protein
MSVCRSIKGYAREHEQVADFFSLLAVGLFFGSLYLGATTYGSVTEWIKQDLFLHSMIILALLLLDVFLIFLFLNIGSARSPQKTKAAFRHSRDVAPAAAPSA